MGGGFGCGPAEGAGLVVDVPSVELAAHEFPGECLEVGAELSFFGGGEQVGEGGPVGRAPFHLAC